ncbi:hypothetical protein B0H16DRAFT_1742900 [Mycena metata]|uniref:F-box domain-containing protein n=1 Tax=Mycena metata TaxID=1033252 RepID=A0AAD7H7M0_9AGAR|nr:hypothetical protein B0H16DRAFT_1742900 [Mycena metata]
MVNAIQTIRCWKCRTLRAASPPNCWSCGAFLPDRSPPRIFGNIRDTVSPDLIDLLESNNPPLESEIPSIRAIIADGEEQLEYLDAQIQDMEVTLAQLICRHREISEHVRQHHAIISPIRSLPAELMCEIFAAALSSYIPNPLPTTPPHKPLYLPIPDEEAYSPPWHLAQVCQSWRRYALSYPRLWSSVVVPRISSTNCGAYNLMNTQLLRSANASLNVHWPNPIPLWLDLMLAHCQRWRTLSISIRYLTSYGPLDWLQPFKGRFHRLERLSIDNRPSQPLPDIFSTSPNLRHVSLSPKMFITYNCHPTPVSLPWGHITHYRGMFAPSKQRRILESAHKLVECALGFNTSQVEVDRAGSPISLPCLRRLRSERTTFLSHLTTPTLEHLWAGDTPPQYMPVLLSFLTRSPCALQTLVLTDCRICLGLIPVLEQLPDLTYLFIDSYRKADLYEADRDATEGAAIIAVFTAMSMSDARSCLCPRLISMVYGYDFGDGLSRKSFFNMASSRLNSTQNDRVCFQHLRLFNSRERGRPATNHPAVASVVQLLRDEGLDAGISDPLECDRLVERLF